MKHTFILLLVIALMGIQQVQSKVNPLRENIQQMIENFKYDQALILLDRAILEDQTSTELYASKGKVLRSLYDYENAINCFGKALEMDSTNNQVLIEMANIYKLQEDYPHALHYYSRALERDTSNTFLKLECGNCYLLNKQYPEALKEFSEVYHKDTLHCYAIKMLAYIYNKVNLPDISKMFYQEAIFINPSDYSSVLGLNSVLLGQNNFQAGIKLTEHFRDSIDARNKWINSANALLYLKNKQHDMAIKRFSNCLALNDTTAFIYKHLGISYYSIDSFDVAKTYLEKAYQLDPEDVNTMQFLGLACSKSFYKELGIFYLEKAVAHYASTQEDLAYIYLKLAEVCNAWSICPAEKKLAASIKAYQFNSNDPKSALSLAIEYENVKNYIKAIEFYQIYLDAIPEKIRTDSKLNYKYIAYSKRVNALKVLMNTQK